MHSIYIEDLLILVITFFILVGGLYWLHKIDLQKQPKKYFFVIVLIGALLLSENFINTHLIFRQSNKLMDDDWGNLYDFVEPIPFGVIRTISVVETNSDRYVVGRTFFGLEYMTVTEKEGAVTPAGGISTFGRIINISKGISLVLIIPFLVLFYFIHLIKSVVIFFIRRKHPNW